MARNGSGGYALPINGWNPAVNGVSATPADWQALINDVAAAIQASVAADGQTPMTGNLQMGGYRLTGAGAPSGAGQSLRWEQLTRGADIPSAATIAIPLEGQLFAVTGSTAITAINATIAGRLVYLKLDAGIVLTHSASLLMPSGVNVTTGADDIAVFVSVSAGVWRCVSYPRFESANYPSATEPAIKWPYMTWADTANGLLKRRNAAGTAWLVLSPLFMDQTTRSMTILTSTNVTVPLGVYRMCFSGCAPSGGSGGSAGSQITGNKIGGPGGGAGAGESIIETWFDVTPGATIAVSMGGPGAAGPGGTVGNDGQAGTNGGDLVVGTLFTLIGGGGGQGGYSSATPAAGGNGGDGFPKGAPGQGISEGDYATGTGGAGGSSPFGGGGSGGRSGQGSGESGQLGGGYGSGPGGPGGLITANSLPGVIGVPGTPGILIIKW